MENIYISLVVSQIIDYTVSCISITESCPKKEEEMVVYTLMGVLVIKLLDVSLGQFPTLILLFYSHVFVHPCPTRSGTEL